jgi:hypothetical protein
MRCLGDLLCCRLVLGTGCHCLKVSNEKNGRDGKKSKRGSEKKINDGSRRQNSERDGVMTVKDDNDGAGRFTNGQLGQAGVRAIDRALARYKIQSGR